LSRCKLTILSATSIPSVTSPKAVYWPLRKAVVYGNVLGSFAVEKYGLDGLLQLKNQDIQKRVKQYERMIRF